LRDAEESGLIVEGEIIETEVEVDATENDAITANEDTSMNIDEPAQVCH
jgi:hypothetical protein